MTIPFFLLPRYDGSAPPEIPPPFHTYEASDNAPTYTGGKKALEYELSDKNCGFTSSKKSHTFTGDTQPGDGSKKNEVF